MSTTLPRLDAVTGALLIGTWASSLLYMAELLQAIHYFRTFKKDDWKLKSYVAVTFAIDTIAAVADYIAVYLYTITHAGDPDYLSKQNEAVPLYLISTCCVACLVQTFLTFRYWRLTKNTIFVCFLFILILASLGAGFTTAFTVALFPAYKDRNKVQISAPINNMLNRLVLRTLQTGTATAVFAVLALITFQIDAENNISVGILYTSGRVYVLSMLINLNIRHSPNSVFTRTTTYDISAQLRDTNESHSSNSGSVKSSPLLRTLQSAASISETQPSEIEMMPTHAKLVSEV
ncbi:hypothetical protein MSAN_00881700 [Mycena sanguinolenta]|uniref:DUF6534 domain-containing protein n=1 Tax=Mycena sanguinolenta TaxID=230812 RepID=A0A8H6YS91_9AGAR|nr:hypothetical protein MSAN_00881700 [Mycena sanguinolenta]